MVRRCARVRWVLLRLSTRTFSSLMLLCCSLVLVNKKMNKRHFDRVLETKMNCQFLVAVLS